MQPQPVVWSFAVGFSPISVFFPVQRTGPANTSSVVVWGLLFIGSGGEQCLYVVSGGGHCRSSVVVGALLSVFADICPHLWVLMVADWWPLLIEHGSSGLLSVFVAPVLVRVLMKGGWCRSQAFVPILCRGEQLLFVGSWDRRCVCL